MFDSVGIMQDDVAAPFEIELKRPMSRRRVAPVKNEKGCDSNAVLFLQSELVR